MSWADETPVSGAWAAEFSQSLEGLRYSDLTTQTYANQFYVYDNGSWTKEAEGSGSWV